MKKNKYNEINSKSRNKNHELKNKLTYLADNAKNRMNNNMILRESISIQKHKIIENKKNFLKYTNLKSLTKNSKEFCKSIQNEINLNNSNVKSENSWLQKIIQELKIKLENNVIKGRETINLLENNIDKLKEKNFLIKNAIQSKENKIKRISQIISILKEENFKIYIAFIEFGESDLEDEIDFKIEFKKSLQYYGILLDKKLIKINKYINDAKKREKKLFHLKMSKKKIINFIKTLYNLIDNFDCLPFPDNRNIIIEGEECLQEPIEFEEINRLDNDETFLSEGSESFISQSDNLINSDIKEFELIRNIFYEKKSKIMNLSSIVKLDLSLINFNKQKLNYDYNEKSLSRNNSKEHDLLSLRIKKLKDEIKVLTDKNDKLYKNIQKYGEKINKLNNILINMNKQNPNSFRIKSIKKRKFLFNSLNTFSNISINSKELSHREDIFHNNKKLNLNDDI
jgi:hypothetical protein